MSSLKINRRQVIIGLAILSLVTVFFWFRFNQPPEVIDYYPREDKKYFSFVYLNLSKKIPQEKIRLVVEPELKVYLSKVDEGKNFQWRLSSPPQPATSYLFKVFYKNKILKKWQVTTPSQPMGVGEYSQEINQELNNYLQRTYLLQHLPQADGNFMIHYYNEHYIAIYVYSHPDQVFKKIQKWKKTLPVDLRAQLKIDWIKP